MTRRAPASSGENSSRTETSKLSDIRCSSASPAPSSQHRSPQASRLTTLRCQFITPFGCPVEPEV